MYDIVIKDGKVIDPSQNLNEQLDLAILDGKIVNLQRNVNEEGAEQVIDASGLLVTPGLIDMHVHCCPGIAKLGIDPEFSCLAKGSTTVLDVGSTGHLNFTGFRNFLIERCKTRIIALLNIESLGMIETQNEKWPKLIMEHEEMFINIDDTVKMIRENRDVILGLKWAHHTPLGLKLAREAADKAECILMAENHFEPETIKYLKKGDMVTHTYHAHRPSLKRRPDDGLFDENGNVHPEFYEAIKRGAIIDVGHGAGSFAWHAAEKGLKEGIKPDTISTDLHVRSFNGPAYDMATTMSKFLLLGMSLDEVVRASTTKPAEVLGKPEKIGNLRPGACADVTILEMQEGKFVYTDVYKDKRKGSHRLNVRKVIREGEIIV